MKFVFALTSILTVGGLLAQAPNPLRGEASQPVEPYKVIGNIYYVGAVNISSHIIVTPEGLILLDTGTQEMLPGIRPTWQSWVIRCRMSRSSCRVTLTGTMWRVTRPSRNSAGQR